MFRFSIRGVFVLTAMALFVFVFGASPATTAVGVQDSNLACNDGTNMNLALDPLSLAGLTDAVSAISLFPAGNPALACGLSQQSDPAGGNGPHDFAVGGGHIAGGNFGLSAHATTDAPTTTPQQGVGGSFTFTRPASSPPQGHFVAKVDCFVSPAPTSTSAGSAQATAVITKGDGYAATFVGLEIRIDVLDSGIPGPQPNGDMLGANFTAGPCDFSAYTPNNPLDQGNLNVHNDDQ